jgi:hypothetical protein
LSMTCEVMFMPVAMFLKCVFNSSISFVSSMLIFLRCWLASSMLSLTSRRSFANLVMAYSLVESISFLYLLMVLSFSAS